MLDYLIAIPLMLERAIDGTPRILLCGISRNENPASAIALSMKMSDNFWFFKSDDDFYILF